MEKIIKPSRTAVLGLVLFILTAIYFSVLYKFQIIDKRENSSVTDGAKAVTVEISASRGALLDRNGVLLVSDRAGYNVVIDRSKLLEQEDPNAVVAELINTANQFNITYTDTFPVTMSAPFAYTALSTDTQDNRLASYYEYFDLDSTMTAPELISWMRNHYEIDYTVTAEEARRIIGVRYELEIRAIVSTTDYVFATDVGTEFASYVKERSFPAVSVETTPVREYHTTYAAHILGNMGYMSGDDYQNIYKDLGYSLNDQIGLSGAESAFEKYLRGVDGEKTVYRDESGAVIGETVNSSPTAGNNVYLTIDIMLQKAAEDALASAITDMNTEREKNNELYAQEVLELETAGSTEEPTLNFQELAEGGAVVVIDVNSGDVLASASYPTFDPSSYSQNYQQLSSDPLKPIWNRATQGTYNPGSTFKLVTAFAALKAGNITTSTLIEDKGIYTKYETFQPRCWIYPGNHGFLNVVGAIENSCNYFFYSIADEEDGVGIDAIADAAAEFGLGAKTGIEIGEATGNIASSEYKREELGEGWWRADTLIAAIGQSYNMFTPIQMANYIAAIANGGTVYSTTLLKYAVSSDYSKIVTEESPKVLNTIEDENGYIPVLQQGMRAVAETGTAASYFANYEIPVAAKTGTTQSDTTSMNTGVFVCYAPADDPEIAVAVVVEKGGSGAALATIAKDVLTEYFQSSSISEPYYGDNSIIK